MSEAERLAAELDAVPENGADPQLIEDAAAELASYEAAQAEAKPAPAADGFVLVPVEPTGDMLDGMLSPWLKGNLAERQCLEAGYRAMLAAAPAAPAPHPDERADLAERIEAAHEASLDGDHRACCAILTECLKMLAFPKVAPMTGPKVAFWVYEWLHPTDGSVTLRSLRPEDHCRKPDRAIPVPLMDEWVQWAKAAAPAEVPELVALLRLVEEIAGANSAQVAPVYSELAGNALADYRAAISASKGGA